MALTYGTKNNVISKIATFGTTLTNNTAAVGNYTVYAVTVQDPWDSGYKYTYPAVKGQVTVYQQFLNISYGFRRVEITCSGNSISAKIRRSNGLDEDSASGNTNATVSQIRGLG